MIRELVSPIITFEASATTVEVALHVPGSKFGPVVVILTPTEARSLADHLHVYYEAANRV